VAEAAQAGVERVEMSAVRVKRAAATSPRPWAGIAALIGAFGLLMWLPSWSLSGVVAPLGLASIAAGWRSAPRRWLLWLALAANAVLLVATAVAWAAA
jgi:hypothetical protein